MKPRIIHRLENIINFFRLRKSLVSILISITTILILIIIVMNIAIMQTSGGELSAVGSVIIEVFSISLGLILAFTYDSFIKKLELEQDKKNILLGIKEEIKTILDKINNDSTLFDILSQRTYYESIINSDSVQKILDTTHFQMISEIYKKVEFYYKWLSNENEFHNEKLSCNWLDHKFSALYSNGPINQFDYNDWLKLICQLLYLSNQNIEDWTRVKVDEGTDTLVREFEINSFNFIDNLSLIEKQGLLSMLFPGNDALFKISKLRTTFGVKPINLLNEKRREYFSNGFGNALFDYSTLVNHIFNKYVPLKRTKSIHKSIFIYKIQAIDSCTLLAIRTNEEFLQLCWVGKEELKYFLNDLT